MKRFLMKLSDIQNVYRVLEIMDNCACDIEKDMTDGFSEHDCWRIKPKWTVTEKEARDLQNIILHKEHYGKRSKFWKLLFPNFIEGGRFFWWQE